MQLQSSRIPVPKQQPSCSSVLKWKISTIWPGMVCCNAPSCQILLNKHMPTCEPCSLLCFEQLPAGLGSLYSTVLSFPEVSVLFKNCLRRMQQDFDSSAMCLLLYLKNIIGWCRSPCTGPICVTSTSLLNSGRHGLHGYMGTLRRFIRCLKRHAS